MERPRQPKLAGWKPFVRVTREPIRGQNVKDQGHRVTKCKIIAAYTPLYAYTPGHKEDIEKDTFNSHDVPEWLFLYIPSYR